MELAESLRDIAGHVFLQMLKHYSHIRMKARREDHLTQLSTSTDIIRTGIAVALDGI